MHRTDDVIQVRMIGQLAVRRADGTVVEPSEWRTAKTRDLFRMLVLEEGRPVRIDRILAALWPDVDRSHGAASLRTAASRIRVVTRSACVVREGQGLAVRGVSSDVTQLEDLVNRLQRLRDEGRPAAVVELARRHHQLLQGDLDADAGDGDDPRRGTWADDARARVTGLQRELLTVHAECSAAVGRLPDAAELSQRAIERDPLWERPYRVLMRALAAMGEADQALRAFERLRTTLRHDLGIEPSPQTCAVRDQILASTTRSASPDPSPYPAAPRAVLRIPAEPGWGPSVEQYVHRWLRSRAHGTTIRVQATVLGEPDETFALDVTAGVDGLVELVENPPEVPLPTS